MGGGKRVKAFEALSRYALAKYGDEFEAAAPYCPYETRMRGVWALCQELAWFVYQWENPKTGKTILDEFVQKKTLRDHVGPGGDDLASRMLLRKDITYDEFEVVGAAAVTAAAAAHTAAAAAPTVRIRAKSTGKEYDMVVPTALPPGFSEGFRFVGRIHPRGDGTHAACGVLTRPGEWDGPPGAESAECDIFPENSYSKTSKAAGGLVLRRPDGRAWSLRSEGVLEVARIRTALLFADRSSYLPKMSEDERRQIVFDEMIRENAAFGAMMSKDIGDGSKIRLRAVLDGYSEEILWMMCRELEIRSLPSRDMMIERIASELPRMVRAILYEMNEPEQSALAHVLHCRILPYPECSGELTRRSMPGYAGSGKSDLEVDHTFLNGFWLLGLLVVGTSTANGRSQQIVTVASDIRGRILECPGWAEYVDSDAAVRTVESAYT